MTSALSLLTAKEADVILVVRKKCSAEIDA